MSEEVVGMQNPLARTATFVGQMISSKESSFKLTCGMCGIQSQTDTEKEEWGIHGEGVDNEECLAITLCPKCVQRNDGEITRSLQFTPDQRLFHEVVKTVIKRVGIDKLITIHAFSEDHSAWYLLPSEADGPVLVKGLGEFYNDYGPEHIYYPTDLAADTDDMAFARVALGHVLGTCTYDALVCMGHRLAVQVTGEPYMGAIPLPHEVVEQIRCKKKAPQGPLDGGL